MKKDTNLLTTLQICNELKIVGYYRDFVYHKYKGVIDTSKNWKSNLKKDGLDMK